MKGWYSRGYLPHFDGGEILQFVTLHLKDALPVKVIERWKMELAREKDDVKQKILFRKCEKYLDAGYGECFLKIEVVAELVKNSLLYFDGNKYKLAGWVIMPNHLHLLFKPLNETSLTNIMHSFKSFTSQKANQLLNRKGKFWQEDYFNRFIRNYEHFEKTLNYIELNPVKAGLCEKAADWKYSSAYRSAGIPAREE